MFLTEKEIRHLTGRVYGKAQCRQLERLGIRYTPDADGHPVVAREEYLRHAVGGKRNRPDFSWMREAG